jgi:hypothetical protein
VLRRIAKLTGGEYVASTGFSGPALASRIMTAGHAGAPAAAPFASPRSSGSVVASPPVPATPERAADGASGAARNGRVLTIPAVLAVLAAAALAFLALRRRSRPRCPTCRRPLPSPLEGCAFCAERAAAHAPTAPSRREREAAVAELSPTVVARVGSTEEYLEKTIVLRERPVLAVTRGPLAGQVFELSAHSGTSLGRAKANDVVLDDLSVSSQHCRIRPEEEGFMLLDLKSTNGTFVNERRVTAHRLAEGDVIKLGEMQLQFRMEQRRG